MWEKQLCYLLGLWCADRGSTARGVVAIRNKRDELLEPLRKFGTQRGMKVKEREVVGYSKTREVYVCNTKLRKLFDSMRRNKTKVLNSKQKILAYFAGLFDGDGTVILDNSKTKIRKVRIYYSKQEINDSLTDAKLLETLGIRTRVWSYGNIVIMDVYDRNKFLRMIKPFIRHKEKLERIEKGLGNA